MTKTGKFLKAIILMAAAMAVIMLSGCSSSSIDYIATVKAHAFYTDMPNATIDDVMNKVIVSPVWTVSESDGTHYVTVSGELNKVETDFSATISVTENPDDKDRVIFKVTSLTMGDNVVSTSEQATNVLYNLFCVYNDGYDNVEDWAAAQN